MSPSQVFTERLLCAESKTGQVSPGTKGREEIGNEITVVRQVLRVPGQR